MKQLTFRIGTRNTKDIRYEKNPTVAIIVEKPFLGSSAVSPTFVMDQLAKI